MAFDKQKLEAMTVNERLFDTGQMDQFEAAVETKNLPLVRSILESIYVDDLSILRTLENIEKWGTAHDPTWTPDRP